MDRRAEVAALQPLEALRVEAPRRPRVEHRPAADGRRRAQHDPVAAGGHDRLREPQLREAAATDDARPHVGRPEVRLHVRGNLRELLERDVEPVRDRERARLDERVAARELRPLDPRQRDRDPLPGLCALDRPVVHLHASYAHVEAARLDPQRVALADRARPERPGHDRADPAQGEDAVDPEPRRARRRRVLDRVGGASERGPKLVEPLARLGAHRDRLGLGHELPRLLERELERLRVDRVRLRDRDHARPDPEQAQDREVLERLRPRALGGVDHEQEEVDPGRARDHRPDEPLVARHVDHGEPSAVRQFERGVTEVDRDPARLLLRQPVGVLAGQRPDEPRLAVVDVARGADGERHRADATAS